MSHRVRALTRRGAAWDDCSDTPFLYNSSRKTVVTYDDTWSLGDKALFAKQNGMAGCFTWSLDQVSLRSHSAPCCRSETDGVSLAGRRLHAPERHPLEPWQVKAGRGFGGVIGVGFRLVSGMIITTATLFDDS